MKQNKEFVERYEAKSYQKIFFLYTCEFVGITFFLFLFLNKYSLIGCYDAFNQYYPVFRYIGKYVTEIMQELFSNGKISIPQFDFQIGFGEGIIPALNYYGFGDPFVLTFAVFFSKYPVFGYMATIFIKLYVAGSMFLFWGVKRKYQMKSLLIAVLVYIFNGFTFFMGFQYPMFINVLISFIMVIIGIDQIVYEKRKLSNMFIVGVLFQALSGFYFLFMLALFTAIYWIIIVIVNKKTIKETIEIFRTTLNSVLLGIGTSGVILYPSIYGFLTSSRTNSVGSQWISHFQINFNKFLKMIGSLSIPKEYSNLDLAIPIGICFFVIIYLLFNREKNEIKYFLMVMLASIPFIEFFSWVAGGFSDIVYYGRFFFALYFAVAAASIYGIEQFKKLNGKRKYPVYFLLLGLLLFVCIFTDLWINKQEIKILRYLLYLLFAFISFCLLVLTEKKKKYQSIVIWASVVGNIVLNIGILFAPNFMNITIGNTWDWYKRYEALQDDKVFYENIEKLKVEDEQFYRIDIHGQSNNDALYAFVNGTSEYFSILNGNLNTFYEKFGITGDYHSSYSFAGIDDRIALKNLLNVKYSVNEQGDIEENEFYYPMGVIYEHYITEQEAEKLHPLIRNDISNHIVILDEGTTLLESTEYTTDVIEQSFNYGMDDSKAVIEFIGDGNVEYYLYIDDKLLSTYAYVDINNRITKTVYNHNNPCDYGLVNLGELSGGNVITISSDDLNVIKKENIHILTSNVFDRPSKDTIRNAVYDSDYICGEVRCKDNSLLFFSIPYSKGWSAKLDGKKVKIQKADYSFIAVPLSKGEHKIELSYKTPGIKFGTISTILSILIWGVYSIRIKHKENGEK